MTRHNKKNHSHFDRTPFVQLHHWEFDCPAYRALSLPARALYSEFKRRYNGINNGEIHFSIREMKKALGVGSQTTVVKAQHELQQKGFIKVAQLATFDTRKERTASNFILTCAPLFDVSPTKEFMRWQPGADFKVKAGKSAHQKKHSSTN